MLLPSIRVYLNVHIIMLISCYVYKLHELLIVVHVYMCTVLFVWDKILGNDRY